MKALETLGLGGGYQVHAAPTVLRADLRAHQVFTGFSDWHEATTQLRRLMPPETPCWVVEGENATAQVLEELKAASPDAVLVVPATQTENPGGLYGVVWLVDRLLGPGGCPWDQEQTHVSLKRHLIEEAYELCQAIDDGDDDKMQEELGDVLLQPVMHAQMRHRDGAYGSDEVATRLVEKLVHRHPHVFGDIEASTAEQVLQNWDEIKKKEKGSGSILAGVPAAMPQLLRAFEVSKRAARSGFEWPDIEAVWDKLHEEERELRSAIESQQGVAEEVGDLLFTAVNIARWAGVEPEDALRAMLTRFTERFQAMEQAATKPLKELSPQEWDDLWEQAKSSVRIGEQ